MQVLRVRATLRSTMHMVVAILCHMSEEVASNLEVFNALRALNTKKQLFVSLREIVINSSVELPGFKAVASNQRLWFRCPSTGSAYMFE